MPDKDSILRADPVRSALLQGGDHSAMKLTEEFQVPEQSRGANMLKVSGRRHLSLGKYFF